MTIGEYIKEKDKETYDKLMRIGTRQKTYLCDAEKNINCKKKNCYLNGGPCMKTIDVRFAKKKDCK